MDTEQLLRMDLDKIKNLTKAEILDALKYKFTVTNKLDEKEKEKENHDKEMKEFRTCIESLASCLSLDIPRDYYYKIDWQKTSVPMIIGKVFAEIAKIDYSKELNKKED